MADNEEWRKPAKIEDGNCTVYITYIALGEPVAEKVGVGARLQTTGEQDGIRYATNSDKLREGAVIKVEEDVPVEEMQQ